jgi:DnaK suppressor protein
MRMATKNASKADKPLTEADILKMPEKDYMNEAQLAFFRDLLARMRDDILRKADETVEHMREVDNVSDPADRATVEEEHTLELRTRDRERKLLKKIEQAIERIDAGEYGYCDETGEPIGIRRLLARPTATLTIEAQERRERLQKLYGD